MDSDNNTSADSMTPTVALNLYTPSSLGVMPSMRPAGSTRTAGTEVRYGFRLGNLGFLIHHNADSEIIDLPTIFRIPNCSYWMRGVINLRGNLVPVFDIAWLLKIERRNTSSSMLLVLDKGDAAVGILIEDLPVAVSLASLSPLPQFPPVPEVIKRYIKKGYTQDSQVWFEFEHREFFASLGERMRA